MFSAFWLVTLVVHHAIASKFVLEAEVNNERYYLAAQLSTQYRLWGMTTADLDYANNFKSPPSFFGITTEIKQLTEFTSIRIHPEDINVQLYNSQYGKDFSPMMTYASFTPFRLQHAISSITVTPAERAGDYIIKPGKNVLLLDDSLDTDESLDYFALCRIHPEEPKRFLTRVYMSLEGRGSYCLKVETLKARLVGDEAISYATSLKNFEVKLFEDGAFLSVHSKVDFSDTSFIEKVSHADSVNKLLSNYQESEHARKRKASSDLERGHEISDNVAQHNIPHGVPALQTAFAIANKRQNTERAKKLANSPRARPKMLDKSIKAILYPHLVTDVLWVKETEIRNMFFNKLLHPFPPKSEIVLSLNSNLGHGLNLQKTEIDSMETALEYYYDVWRKVIEVYGYAELEKRMRQILHDFIIISTPSANKQVDPPMFVREPDNIFDSWFNEMETHDSIPDPSADFPDFDFNSMEPLPDHLRQVIGADALFEDDNYGDDAFGE